MHLVNPLSLAICIVVFTALVSAIVWFVRVRGRKSNTLPRH